MNITEILKQLPTGTKLYSPVFGEVEFVEITTPCKWIKIKTKTGDYAHFYSDGKFNINGECILFPAKNKSWDDFLIPFEDGDIIILNEPINGCPHRNTAVFKKYNDIEYNKMSIYCQVNGSNKFVSIPQSVNHKGWRKATFKEIQEFIGTMHKAGYDFVNSEVIPLPKFKVGDIITNGTYTFKIAHIDNKHYYEKIGTTVNRLLIQDQDKWKLKKFDIHSLKPYDKVLVKNGGCWYPTLVSYIESSGEVYLIDTIDVVSYVIPFEGNEHLIGKFDDPDPYYITW